MRLNLTKNIPITHDLLMSASKYSDDFLTFLITTKAQLDGLNIVAHFFNLYTIEEFK